MTQIVHEQSSCDLHSLSEVFSGKPGLTCIFDAQGRYTIVPYDSLPDDFRIVNNAAHMMVAR